MLLQANAIRLEALWAYLYHEDAAMEQLQQDALKAAYSAFIARSALNIGEQAESRPGQDNLLNMTMQQVGRALHCCFPVGMPCICSPKLSSGTHWSYWQAAVSSRCNFLSVPLAVSLHT